MDNEVFYFCMDDLNGYFCMNGKMDSILLPIYYHAIEWLMDIILQAFQFPSC